MDKIKSDDLEKSVQISKTFKEVIINLGFEYNNSLYKRIQREVYRLNIDISHFYLNIQKERYNKDRLIYLSEKYKTLKEILIELDLLPISSNYTRLKHKLKEFNINVEKFDKKLINKWNKEDFSKIIEESKNLSDVCKNIGLEPFYGNRQTIKKYIDKYDIDTSHFRFNNDNKKINKYNLSDLLVEKSNYNTTNLKERLYNEGYKERRCEFCGQTEEWNGMKISLILDHINGVNNDHRIENLRILCPNCNAGLDTHCGKNIKNKKYDYTKEIKKIKEIDIIKENISNIKKCECGKTISDRSKYCKECYDIKQRKVERPDKETLLKDVKELGYTGTGKKYGVSDNSIRKWIKKE